jgi:hypothetical protein
VGTAAAGERACFLLVESVLYRSRRRRDRIEAQVDRVTGVEEYKEGNGFSPEDEVLKDFSQ